MGVDARIYLPANVRVDDVADVIGALLGRKPERQDFGGNSSGWSTKVPGVSVETTSIPEMAAINVNDCPVLNGRMAHICYHFEGRGGRRAILLRSYAQWIAMFKRLADFFGGTVDFSDCDDSEADYVVAHKSDAENHAEDNVEWYDLQARKLEVQSLTPEEIAACVEFAAYKE